MNSDMTGHNSQDKSIEKSDIADQLAATCNAWLDQVPEIENEEQAQKATDFLARTKEELKETEAARKDEKAPHHKAGVAVDDKYKPIRAKLEIIKNLMAPKLTAWLNKKEAERREEARNAEAKALEKIRIADEARKKAEDALKAAESSDVVGATIAADEANKAADVAVKQADDVSKAKSSVKGHYSDRKTSLRTTYSAEVVDYTALLSHYSKHPTIRAALDQLANQWARSPEGRKTPLPGAKLVEKQSV